MTLLEAARSLAQDIVADRRDFHRHPELGFQEVRTAGIVAERLRTLGYDEVRTGVGGTGVVALLRGGAGGGVGSGAAGGVGSGAAGKTVLLRADMDALPIQEDGELAFASETGGVMHACGHDAHTAILLGAARLLAERRAELNGAVKLMFQPAEENGGAGALRMIEDGLLEGPSVDAAFALHVDGRFTPGQVGLRAGPMNGASDRFVITIRGRGGHASAPHRSVDPIVVGAYVITALQTLISRELSPGDQGVVTVGSLTAGTIFNAIPDFATLKGTFRASTPEVRAHLRRRIEEVAQGIASTMRATAEYEEYGTGYPVMVCDPAMVEVARGAAAEVLGAEAVLDGERTMGGEDFSFVLERVPGAFIRLGTRNPAWETPPAAHSARFRLDEEALPYGAAVMAAVALRYLDGSGVVDAPSPVTETA